MRCWKVDIVLLRHSNILLQLFWLSDMRSIRIERCGNHTTLVMNIILSHCKQTIIKLIFDSFDNGFCFGMSEWCTWLWVEDCLHCFSKNQEERDEGLVYHLGLASSLPSQGEIPTMLFPVRQGDVSSVFHSPHWEQAEIDDKVFGIWEVLIM